MSYFVAVQKSLSHLHALGFLCVQGGFNPVFVSEHVNQEMLIVYNSLELRALHWSSARAEHCLG